MKRRKKRRGRRKRWTRRFNIGVVVVLNHPPHLDVAAYWAELRVREGALDAQRERRDQHCCAPSRGRL